MCGIAGFATEEGVQLTPEQATERNRFFTSLLWSMESRGNQSTGVAMCDSRTGLVRLRKRAVSASHFIVAPGYHKLLDQNPEKNVCIGHTRQATTGAVNRHNAHPFQYGQVVGCHNGFVRNWREIDNKVNVDSEVIFKVLSESEDPKAALAKLAGVFAVAWFDARTAKVYIARGGNPAILAYSKELGTYFWASEPDPIGIASLATGISLTYIELKDDTITTLDLRTGERTQESLTWAKTETIVWERKDGATESSHKSGFGSYYRDQEYLSQYDNWPDELPKGLPSPKAGYRGDDEQPCYHCEELAPFIEDLAEWFCRECEAQERLNRAHQLVPEELMGFA